MASHSFLPAKCKDTTGFRIESKEEESVSSQLKWQKVVTESCYKITVLGSLHTKAHNDNMAHGKVSTVTAFCSRIHSCNSGIYEIFSRPLL